MSAPFRISSKVPIKPNKIPINCFFLNPKPKTKTPIINVLKGVKEFNMEAIALSISWTANENKKTGKNVPKKAV